VTAEKGEPLTPREAEIVAERTAAARAWLDMYAPDSAKFAVRHDALPAEATALDDVQRRFLGDLADSIEADPPVGGDAWQTRIFETARALDLPARRAFEAIYLAFLGRPNGPRAGWLLAPLDRTFVLERARAAVRTVGTPA
jgi:lysyl-tRNA synthetase class 1